MNTIKAFPGFVLQMCTARYIGLFLEDPLAVSWPVDHTHPPLSANRCTDGPRPERERALTEDENLRESATETRHESGLAYDSAERRSTTAASFEGRGFDQRSVQTRMSADVSQGKSVTESVKKPRATKVRKKRANVGGRKASNPGPVRVSLHWVRERTEPPTLGSPTESRRILTP